MYFAANAMVLTDCENPSTDIPGLTVSLRGLYEVELVCEALEADVHSVSGAPKEAFVKIEKAEDGGVGAERLWRPVTLGLRPEAPSEALVDYLAGDYVGSTGS